MAMLPLIGKHLSSLFIEAEPLLMSPVDAPGGFGWIRNDVNGKGLFGANRDGGRTHKGVDLLGEIGGPVIASKSGRVIAAGWQKGYGGYIKILHPGKEITVYAHLSRVLVEKADWVSQGQSIGQIGKSGNAQADDTLPHLHFEHRIENNVVDPVKSLAIRLISSINKS